MIAEVFEKIINNYTMVKEEHDFEKLISEVEFLKDFLMSQSDLSSDELKHINTSILKKCITDITEKSNHFYERIPLFFYEYIERYSVFVNDEILEIIKNNSEIQQKIDFLLLNINKQKIIDIYPMIISNISLSFEEKLKVRYGEEFIKNLIKINLAKLRNVPINKVKWFMENKFLNDDDSQFLLINIIDLKSYKALDKIKEQQKELVQFMNNETKNFYYNSIVFEEVKQTQTKNQLMTMVKSLNLPEVFKHRTKDNCNFLHYVCKSNGASYLSHLLKAKKLSENIKMLLKEKNKENMTPLDILFSNWYRLSKISDVKQFFKEEALLSSPKLDFIDMTQQDYSTLVKDTFDALYEKDLLLKSCDFSVLKNRNYSDILKIAQLLLPYFLDMSFKNKNIQMNDEQMQFGLVLVCLLDEMSEDNFKKINIIKHFIKNKSKEQRETILKSFSLTRKIILSNSDLSKNQLKNLTSVEKLQDFDNSLKLVREYFSLNELIEPLDKPNKKRL